ncbi:MAG: translation factor Sua5 [Treponema sp. CETP13]|nr:MAG: translation factor Sua5 [Treponema sp. CETP13]
MILSKNNNTSIDKTATILNSGKIAIIPTDTVYGFSGIVPQTDKEIRKIKGRAETKPFIQLISNPEDIYSLTKSVVPKKLIDLWPGALTIIVQDKNSETTTAYRCPADEWIRSVLSKCNTPLYSTSVNRSGHSILETIEDIKKEFSKEVALIIDDGDRKNALPSTIVDITDGTIRILRQGSLRIH